MKAPLIYQRRFFCAIKKALLVNLEKWLIEIKLFNLPKTKKQ